MRKIIIIMSALVVLLSMNVCAAMNMFQLVKIGELTGVNMGGFIFKQCLSNNGNITNIRKGSGTKVYDKGIATFGSMPEKLYLHYKEGNGSNHFTKFGGADINNTYDIKVMHMNISEIKTDEGITLYLLDDVYEFYDTVEYTLLGRRPDGKYVKYFSTKETVMNYFYTDTGYPKYGAYSPQISKDTISFKLTNWDGSKLVGEIVYKWDNNAQWFSVAVNQY